MYAAYCSTVLGHLWCMVDRSGTLFGEIPLDYMFPNASTLEVWYHTVHTNGTWVAFN